MVISFNIIYIHGQFYKSRIFFEELGKTIHKGIPEYD